MNAYEKWFSRGEVEQVARLLYPQFVRRLTGGATGGDGEALFARAVGMGLDPYDVARALHEVASKK